MGRPQFQMLTATLPSESLATLTQTPATAIAAGDSEQITFYSASGTKSRAWGAYLNADIPTGGTAGTHGIAVSVSGFNLTQGTSNYDNPVTFLNGYWSSATSAAQPNTGLSPQSWWLNTVQFDATNGLVCTYTNGTTGGTSDASTRTYNLLTVEEDLP